jgi:hypothetical protein
VPTCASHSSMFWGTGPTGSVVPVVGTSDSEGVVSGGSSLVGTTLLLVTTVSVVLDPSRWNSR